MFGTIIYQSHNISPQESQTQLPTKPMVASGALIDAEHLIRNTVCIVVKNESDPNSVARLETSPQNRSALACAIIIIEST
mmetsp:Transcript_128830/g.257293  ORF Transcript_128830/g.257293 Transcript_128830/m.257293 type:complete len:80 (+) Transcript_128830:52-291(+)